VSLLEPRFIAPRDGWYHTGHGPIHHEDDCPGQCEMPAGAILVSFDSDDHEDA
jgi:hypothetical protein